MTVVSNFSMIFVTLIVSDALLKFQPEPKKPIRATLPLAAANSARVGDGHF